MANQLIGYEVESGEITTQVYKATHNGAGESLPLMNRSFISFTFGDRAIEDFNLISIFNDKLNQDLYSSFQDSTSTYDTLDGQLYWGSHFEAKKISLNLATDEITERQLDDFREWFTPGVRRELRFAEKPNRAIMARVADAPQIEMIPFEKKVSYIINSQTVETSTTVYRGSINLNLVMDDPYWYAKMNYMPTFVNKKLMKEFDSNSELSNDEVEALTNKDMLKIMYEDGIPHQSILNSTMFLGGNRLVRAGALVASEGLSEEEAAKYAHVGKAYLGIIGINSTGLDVNPDSRKYLFYSGTAKCYPKIKFTLTPSFDSEGYITCPKNSYTNNGYSYIQIGNSRMEFTTPSMLTGYNQAINLINRNLKKIELLDKIKTEVNEYYARAWAISVIQMSSDNTSIESKRNNMKAMFMQNENILPITFIIDSKTGEAIGEFQIQELSNGGSVQLLRTVSENVGDMIRSKYLVIEGRDYLNSNGEIDLGNCHQITSNESLTDVLVFYKNMYL